MSAEKVRRPPRGCSGFTLVELVVVIAILSLLAAVGAQVYTGYIEKASAANDLQLLSAMNTAFASACAERGIEPSEIKSVNVPLDGEGKLSLSQLSVVPNDPALVDSFISYYGDNADTPFRSYKKLFYDPEKGGFVDGTGLVRIPYGDVTLTVREEDLNRLLAHDLVTHNNNDVTKLMESVGSVSDGVAELLNSETGQGIRSLLGSEDFKSFYRELTGKDPSSESNTTLANALVLYSASRTGTLDAPALANELETKYSGSSAGSNDLHNLIGDFLSGDNISAETVNKVAGIYGVQLTLDDKSVSALVNRLRSPDGIMNLSAYLSAMSMISDNLDNQAAVEQLLQDGFGSELAGAVNSAIADNRSGSNSEG